MKRKIFSAVAFILLTVTATFAQSQFKKSFGNPNAYEEFYSVCQTPDGGYAFFGNSLNPVTQITDLLVVKTDADGNLQWSKTYAYSLDLLGTKIICNATGELFLLSYTFENSPPYDDIILVKTDETGTILWSNRYGGTDIDEGNDMAIDNNGDIIIAGYTYSFGAVLKSGFAIKVNSSGVLQWSNAYSQNINQEFNGVSVSTGNSYVFTGLTQRTSGINFDGFVIKTNAAGTITWAKRSGGSGVDTYYHSYTDVNGSLYVSGASSTGGTGSNLDGLLVSYDAAGNRALSKTYGTNAVDRTYSISNGPAASNNLVLSGHTNNSSGFENNMILFVDKTTGTLSYHALAGSTQGNSRAFGLAADGNAAVEAGFIFTATDTLGSAYAVKYSYSVSPCNIGITNFSTGSPAFVDSTGATSAAASPVTSSIALTESIFNPDTVLFCGTTSVQELNNAASFVISPNPVYSEITLSLANSLAGKPTKISIADTKGSIVKRIFTQQLKTNINIGTLEPGIYSFIVETGGKFFVKKFVKLP